MNSRFLYNTASANLNKSYNIARIVAIAVAAALFLYRVLLIFSYNGELAGIDNNFVFDVSRSIEDIGPYTNPAAAPYAITLYSPLYFSVCAVVGKLLHVNPDNAIGVYQLCRTLSLLADIITCILLYRILRKRFETGSELSWLAVACFACILCKLGYTFSRSDSFLLAFYAAVIYVLAGRSPKTTAQIFLLSVFSAGCILSKQNGIIIPVIIFTWLFLSDEKKSALLFFIFFLVISSVAVVIYRMNYPYLFANTITALRNRIDISWFYGNIFKRSMDSLWILPLYFAAVLSVRHWIKPALPEDKSLAAAFLIQILFSLAISLKWGSSISYFNECFFLALVILFRTIAAWEQSNHAAYIKKAISVLLPLVVLFFVHTTAEGYLFFLKNRETKKMLYNQQKEIRDYLRPKLQGRYVINLIDPNTNFFKTLFYKEMAVPNMDMADCCTIPDKTFDYSSLKQDLSNGGIGFLITAETDKPGILWDVSLHHYSKDTVISGYAIYSFKPAMENSR